MIMNGADQLLRFSALWPFSEIFIIFDDGKMDEYLLDN